VIRYAKAIPHGVRRDTLYVFESRGAARFRAAKPRRRGERFPSDGIAEIRRLLVETDDFKFNCRWC